MTVSKHYHIQPSELERMPYWEYELLLDCINQDIKEENKRNEGENKKYGNMNTSSMMRDAQRNMPKFNTPTMPSFPRM
jgi:hypothetical protein